jgi:hypothetical protein
MQSPERFKQHAGIELAFVHSGDLTAVCAERMEYSTVNTTSSGSSQYCPAKARFFEPSGLTMARSPLLRGRNWLVMKGIMHGMQVQVSRILAPRSWRRKWPMISVMISRPVHADMGFFTKLPGMSTNSP